MKTSDKVVLAYVHPVDVSAYFLQSIVGVLLYDLAGPHRIANIISEVSSANISRARNTLVQRFLDGKGEWLLFVDADMAFPPNAVEEIGRNAHTEKAPIVGGLCFGVNDGVLFPTLYGLGQTADGEVGVTRHDGPIPDNTMMQVAATGAAFLLIHRSVLLAVADKGFNATYPWFQETELSGKPCGEDFTFCLRAGQAGFPVWVDTGVAIGHHKSQLLTRELYDAQIQGGGSDGSRDPR